MTNTRNFTSQMNSSLSSVMFLEGRCCFESLEFLVDKNHFLKENISQHIVFWKGNVYKFGQILSAVYAMMVIMRKHVAGFFDWEFKNHWTQALLCSEKNRSFGVKASLGLLPSSPLASLWSLLSYLTFWNLSFCFFFISEKKSKSTYEDLLQSVR